MAGSAAIVASGAAVAVPVAKTSGSIDPNKRVLDLQSALKDAYDHVTPITPAEYLSEIEANGWLPVTRIGVNGEPRRVFEYTVNFPTNQAMNFISTVALGNREEISTTVPLRISLSRAEACITRYSIGEAGGRVNVLTIDRRRTTLTCHNHLCSGLPPLRV
jgi:hypothetical protein